MTDNERLMVTLLAQYHMALIEVAKARANLGSHKWSEIERHAEGIKKLVEELKRVMELEDDAQLKKEPEIMKTVNVTTARELAQRIADVVQNASHYKPSNCARAHEIDQKHPGSFCYLMQGEIITVDHLDVSVNNDEFYELKPIRIMAGLGK